MSVKSTKQSETIGFMILSIEDLWVKLNEALVKSQGANIEIINPDCYDRYLKSYRSRHSLSQENLMKLNSQLIGSISEIEKYNIPIR